MVPLDLTAILKGFESKWVALADDNTAVHGAGDTAKEAAEEAKTKGYPEFTLLFVEPSGFLCHG